MALVSKEHRWTSLAATKWTARRCTSARTAVSQSARQSAARRRCLRKLWRLAAYYCGWSVTPPLPGRKIFHILWNNKFLAFDSDAPDSVLQTPWETVVLTAHNVNAGRRDGPIRLLNRLTLKPSIGSPTTSLSIPQMKDRARSGVCHSRAQGDGRPYAINNALPDTGLSPAAAKERLGIDRTARTILFFGSIAPYKGLNISSPHFQTIAARGGDYRLIVAGASRRSNTKSTGTDSRMHDQP